MGVQLAASNHFVPVPVLIRVQYNIVGELSSFASAQSISSQPDVCSTRTITMLCAIRTGLCYNGVCLVNGTHVSSLWIQLSISNCVHPFVVPPGMLTHWGRVTHICVGTLTIIGSDNGLSPERRQAIIWTNAGILLIGPLGTNFSEILIEIQAFSLKKIRLKMSSAKCC